MNISHLRKSGLALAIAVATGSVATLSTQPARACAMIESGGYDFMSPRRAERLLVAATSAAGAGNGKRARAIALRVAGALGLSAETRAHAWALAGWASWQQGDRALALRAFTRARRLDATRAAIDSVLALAGPPASVADLKKALAG
jgi:hypothetical protein